MNINRKECHWVMVVIQERLHRLACNLSTIEDEEDRKDAILYAQEEEETLENLLSKLYKIKNI